MLYTGLWLEVQEVSPANGAHMLGGGVTVFGETSCDGREKKRGKDYKRQTSHGLFSCTVLIN